MKAHYQNICDIFLLDSNYNKNKLNIYLIYMRYFKRAFPPKNEPIRVKSPKSQP